MSTLPEGVLPKSKLSKEEIIVLSSVSGGLLLLGLIAISFYLFRRSRTQKVSLGAAYSTLGGYGRTFSDQEVFSSMVSKKGEDLSSSLVRKKAELSGGKIKIYTVSKKKPMALDSLADNDEVQLIKEGDDVEEEQERSMEAGDADQLGGDTGESES